MCEPAALCERLWASKRRVCAGNKFLVVFFFLCACVTTRRKSWKLCLFGSRVRMFSSFRDSFFIQPISCVSLLSLLTAMKLTCLLCCCCCCCCPCFQRVAAFVLILTPVRRYVWQTENFIYWILNQFLNTSLHFSSITKLICDRSDLRSWQCFPFSTG